MATFFENQEAFRDWLKDNHTIEKELWVGYYKKATNLPSIAYSESVDQALCYGWVDGIRRKLDEASYQIRFTPRKHNSHWSFVNINKVEKLMKLNLMTAAGLAAYKKRDPKNSGKGLSEQKEVKLSEEFEKALRRDSDAWEFFSNALAPSYCRQSIYWVMSAKKEETRIRRFNTLINCSKEKMKIPPLKWAK